MTNDATNPVELRACPNPWCNSTTAPLPVALKREGWRVLCACGVSTYRCPTEAEAITAWNTRATDKTLAHELRAAAKNASPDTWHVVPYGDGDSLVICKDEAGDQRIAFMATPGCRDHAARKRVWAEIKANARLIVALKNNLDRILTSLEGQG